MNKRNYVKTYIYITLTTVVVTSLLFLWYGFALPGQSFIPLLVIMFISYLLIIGIFTTLFLKYTPLLQAAQKNANLNKILFELMQKSVHVNNRDELYQMILDSAIEAIPSAQKGSIMLLNSSSNLLQFVAANGYDLDILKNTYLRLDQTYLYRESNGKIEHTIFVNDPFAYNRDNLNDKNIDDILEAGHELVLSTLSTPVIYNETLYGMINIDSAFREAYTKEDKRIIEIFALEIVSVLKLYNSIEQVNYYMNHDILTNTYNRKYFNELLEAKVKEATLKTMSLALITIDLNGLKKTNDLYGYDCGNNLLVEFAYGIKKNITTKYHFSRYSGNDFQLLLENSTLLESQQLMTTIEEYFKNHSLTYKAKVIPITFHHGIVTFPEDQKTFKGLINLADKRMYKQKRHL